MRLVREVKQWNALIRERQAESPAVLEVAAVALDLSVPCTVLGGRNGSGKSRLLRLLAGELGDRGLLLDMHHLCEQALIVLRSRDDFVQMVEEYSPVGPDPDQLDNAQRIVGREYDFVEWYALEIELADADLAERFSWAGEQAMVPFFRVSYAGQEYTSRDMGLGEFSIHFLLWILDQYRDEPDVVLLLDEPTAYLPPVAASAFLARLLRVCQERGWSVVLSTHSEELILNAVDKGAFVFLQHGEGGAIVGTHSRDDPAVGEALLARPPVQLVLFVEDESAYYLMRSLLDHIDVRLSRATTIVWKNGDGYLRRLHESLPRPPQPEMWFGYVFDGDQRESLPEAVEGRWHAVCLPTGGDPDHLLKMLAGSVADLASKFGVDELEMRRHLDGLEGTDAHDWVNGLCAVYGRVRALQGLSDLWCDGHPDLVGEFAVEVEKLRPSVRVR